jgi:hypothetical protein
MNDPVPRQGDLAQGADLADSLVQLLRVRKSQPEFERPADQLMRLLVTTFERPPGFVRTYRIELGTPEAEAIRQARAQGRPIFEAVPPSLDENDFLVRVSKILSLVAGGEFACVDIPRPIDLSTMLCALTGLSDSDVITNWSNVLGVECDPVSASIRLALLPALARCSAALLEWGDIPARTGPSCPNCAMPPVLAESRGLDGGWYARCGLCAAAWLIPRLGCAFCGESDARRLISRFVEGQESRYRKVVCESCGSSLKVVSTLTPLSAPGLLVAELAMIHLDFV